LLSAVIFRNLPWFDDIEKSVDPKVSSIVRKFCLVTLLSVGGLSFDIDTFKRKYVEILNLALLPQLIEAASVIFSGYVLLGFSPFFSFTFGYIIAAIAPAVIIPCMLDLNMQGYGKTKGLTTTLFISCTLDNILAITIFSILIKFLIPLQLSDASKPLVLKFVPNNIIIYIYPIVEIIIGILPGWLIGMGLGRLTF